MPPVTEKERGSEEYLALQKRTERIYDHINQKELQAKEARSVTISRWAQDEVNLFETDQPRFLKRIAYLTDILFKRDPKGFGRKGGNVIFLAEILKAFIQQYDSKHLDSFMASGLLELSGLEMSEQSQHVFAVIREQIPSLSEEEEQAQKAAHTSERVTTKDNLGSRIGIKTVLTLIFPEIPNECMGISQRMTKWKDKKDNETLSSVFKAIKASKFPHKRTRTKRYAEKASELAGSLKALESDTDKDTLYQQYLLILEYYDQYKASKNGQPGGSDYCHALQYAINRLSQTPTVLKKLGAPQQMAKAMKGDKLEIDIWFTLNADKAQVLQAAPDEADVTVPDKTLVEAIRGDAALHDDVEGKGNSEHDEIPADSKVGVEKRLLEEVSTAVKEAQGEPFEITRAVRDKVASTLKEQGVQEELLINARSVFCTEHLAQQTDMSLENIGEYDVLLAYARTIKSITLGEGETIKDVCHRNLIALTHEETGPERVKEMLSSPLADSQTFHVLTSGHEEGVQDPQHQQPR
jgi:hypothetical protein